MGIPSVQTIMDRLQLDRTRAETIRGLMDRKLFPLNWPSGWTEIRDKQQKRHDAINGVLGGFGVETLDGADGPEAAYVNMGDTYSATVIYDLHNDRWIVGSYGDFIEQNPRRFGE